MTTESIEYIGFIKMYYELIWNTDNYSVHTRSACIRELRKNKYDTELVLMAIYNVPWYIVYTCTCTLS